MIIFYFHKSQFENMIDCFAMFSFTFPLLFCPAPPPSPPGRTAEPVAMGKIVLWQYSTGQT